MPLAFVGLGANVGDAKGRLRWAVRELGLLGPVRHSSLWASAPVGPIVHQPWFLNAVVALETELAPRPLLDALLAIEARAGRDRAQETPKGPRPLDLDLLLYDDLVYAEGDGSLILPHPRMHERAFALAPLAELVPDAVIPGNGRVADLLAVLGDGQPVSKVCCF
jgi:2-amino-4-hydroxy-6-hydroxymethyldihydropteridine diphosphokinase